MTSKNEVVITKEFHCILETERLMLCAPDVNFANQVFESVSNSFEDIHFFLKWSSRPSYSAICANLELARQQFADGMQAKYHIFERATSSFVGRAGIYELDWRIPRFELGYWCSSAYQGKGYILEAVECLRDYCANSLNAKRIEIRCDSNNIAGQSVAIKLGFEKEATLKNYERNLKGELIDIVIFTHQPGA